MSSRYALIILPLSSTLAIEKPLYSVALDEFLVITKSSPSSVKIFINACDLEASNNVVSILSSNL